MVHICLPVHIQSELCICGLTNLANCHQFLIMLVHRQTQKLQSMQDQPQHLSRVFAKLAPFCRVSMEQHCMTLHRPSCTTTTSCNTHLKDGDWILHQLQCECVCVHRHESPAAWIKHQKHRWQAGVQERKKRKLEAAKAADRPPDPSKAPRGTC